MDCLNRVYVEEAEALIDAYLDNGDQELICKRERLVGEIVQILIDAQNQAYDLIDDNSRLKD